MTFFFDYAIILAKLVDKYNGSHMESRGYNEWRGRKVVVYVVIKAGGTGVRMQPCERPKQFIEVDGKPIILYTLEQFQRNAQVEGICVSCIRGWEGYLMDFAERYGVTKLRWIVEGGVLAQASVDNGIQAIAPYCQEDDIVIIHDAVRPMVAQKLIDRAIDVAMETGASVVTAPCVETMLWSEDGKHCKKTYARNKLYQSRAPQAYRFETLREAYRKAREMGITDSLSTDDLFLRLGLPIEIIVGSVHNIKITTPDDVKMFQAMVAYKQFSNEIWNE